MNNPKISVIIPVYNVEKYLERCLESVLTNQDLTEVEVICIDDGSPDKCPQITDDYAQKDTRVKVIHTKNEGPGIARNEGLKLATGEYIFFLDSDDWIEPNTLSKCYDKIKTDESDVLFFNVILNYEKNNSKSFWPVTEPYYLKFRTKPFRPEEANDVIYKTVANPFRIYKKESLIKYNYQYSEGKNWEDHSPYFCFLANCEKISVLNDYIYNYTVRKTSSTFKSSQKNYKTIFKNYYLCEKNLKETRLGEKFIPYFVEHKLKSFLFYLDIMPLSLKTAFFNKLKSVLKYIYSTYGNEILKTNPYLDNQAKTILKHSWVSYFFIQKFRTIKTVIEMHKL